MSRAIFTDVSQIDLRMEVTRQFAFQYADGNRWAVTKTSDGGATIMELAKTPTTEPYFHVSIDEVPAPKAKSVVDPKDAPEIMNVYNNTGLLERQFLMLDAVYASPLAIEPLPATILNISLASSDPKWKLTCPVVIVTNGGVCEVRTRKNNIRCYDHILVSISETWKSTCAVRHPGKFKDVDELTRYYSDLVFTAACWSDRDTGPSRWTLFCGTRSGLMLLFDIHNSDAVAKSITQTNLQGINLLKNFSFGAEKKNEYVFAGSTSGMITLFRKQSDDSLIKTAVLWEAKDKMTPHCFVVRFNKETNQIIAATSKSSHFILFVLSPEGQLVRKATHYIDYIMIVGIQYFEDNQYMICTLSGYTALLKVNFALEQIHFELEEVKNEIDSNLYQVLGMAATRNKVGWLFLQFPTQLYEHSFRNPTMLTVCSLNLKDPLQIIEANAQTKMYEFADCAEILRCSYLKLGLPDNPFDFDCKLKNIDENFIRLLKIRYMLLTGRMSYFKKKIRNDDALEIQKQMHNIRNVIEVYMAYKRLTYLSSLKKFTSVQKIAGVYFRKRMLDFIQNDTIEWLRDARLSFTKAITELLNNTEEFNSAESEKCVFCDDYVNLDTGTCKERHKVPRCCISFLQIQLFSARACDSCQYAAVDDDNMLKQIMPPDEMLSCPLCDGPMAGAKSQIYLR